MMNKSLVIVLLTSVMLSGCAVFAVHPLDLSQLAAEGKTGANPDEMIKRLRESRARYTLTAAEVIRLHDAGMPDKVLDYLMREQIDDARADERQRDWPFMFRCHRFGRPC